MPRPNAAWRFSLRSIITLSASGNIAGSRLAAGNDSSTMLPGLIGQPLTVVSFTTSRAILPREKARRKFSIARRFRQMPQRRSDRTPGGVDAGDQQQPQRALHMGIGQRLTVLVAGVH